MKPNTLKTITRAFLDARLGSPAAQTQLETWRFAEAQLSETAQLLAEPDAWTTVGRRDDAELLLLAAEILFTVTRETSPEHDPRVVVVCHPARITEVRFWRVGQRTSWQFKFRDRLSLLIEGEFKYRTHPEDDEEFDQAETFARALASRASWQLPAPEEPTGQLLT